MPFIAPNYRGKTSQPEKPPWVRDSSSQQSADVPWRRTSNASNSSTPDRSSSSQESTPPPSAASKPGTSKLQINLKSTKKPTDGPATPSQKEVVIPIKKEVNIPIFREESPVPVKPTAESSSKQSKAKQSPLASSNNEPKALETPKPVEPKRQVYEPPKPPANPAKKHFKVLGSESPFLKPLDPEPPAPVVTQPSPKPPAQNRSKQPPSAPSRDPPPLATSKDLPPSAGRSIPIEIKTATEPSKPDTATAIKKEPKFVKKESKPVAAEVKAPEPKPIVPKANEPKPLGREPKPPANESQAPIGREPKTLPNNSNAVSERELKPVASDSKPLSRPPANESKPSSREINKPATAIEIKNTVNDTGKKRAPLPVETPEPAGPEKKNPFAEGFPRRSVKQREPREKSFSPKPDEEIVNFKRNLKPVANVEKQKSVVKQDSEEKPEPVIKVNLKPVESRKTKELPREEPQRGDMSSRNGPPPPPPPPPPPGMPPPPPPPPGLPPQAPPNPAKVEKLEKLRKMPRRRPDWSDMMKEIEKASPRKLKHVDCNDRSKPILPRMKSRGQFVFDSEAKPATKTDAIHNHLLKEIQGGVKLRKTQTNDRSKPILTGLRKFLRQKTIEEQKEKDPTATDEGPSAAEETPAIDIGLDIDDIDTLRDELQSAKQMLELEIQAKLLLAKENRDLRCQNITMEARIEDLQYNLEQQLALIPYDEGRRDSRALKDIKKSKSGLYKCPSGVRKSKSGFTKGGKNKDDKKGDEEEDLGELNELEEEIATLRSQALAAKNAAEEWETKCKELSEKLLLAQGKNEDSEQRVLVLEKKIEKVQTQKGAPSVSSNDKWTQTEEQIQQQGGRRVSRQASMRKGSTADGLADVAEGGGEDDYGSDDSDLEVDEATVTRKKQEREIKLWENKLRNVKEKQQASQLERKSLKAQQKKLEQELKEQKRRLKELQKEVDKMAKMLKGDKGDDDDDEDDDEDESEEEEDEEESEEEESEEDSDEEESSSESEEEESSSEEDDPAAPHEDRLNLFNKRVKRWDNILNALKKGNYLLRANLDRLKDDLEEVRIKYHDLEHELNTVLADV